MKSKNIFLTVCCGFCMAKEHCMWKYLSFSCDSILSECMFGCNKNSIRWHFNPIAPRKTKIMYNFGLSECKSVNFPS